MASRRSHLLLVALILAALVGTGVLALKREAKLGLDLQGGVEVVLEAVPPKGKELTEEDLERSLEIMRNRVDKLGVSEPEIRKQGDNQIVIQLAGVTGADALDIIGSTARLELYDLQASVTGPSAQRQGTTTEPVPHTSLYSLLSKVTNRAERGRPEGYYLFSEKQKRHPLLGPVSCSEDNADKLSRTEYIDCSRKELAEQAKDIEPPVRFEGMTPPKGYKIFAVPPKTTVITCGDPKYDPEEVGCPGAIGNVKSYYLFEHDPPRVPQLTGEDFELDGTRQDFDTQGGGPIVLMEFTDKGGDKFQEVTKRLYQRGNFVGRAQQFAIVLDHEIRSFPQIDPTDPTLAGGIGGGSAQITGIGSIKEAKDVALVLQTGALPVDFVQKERTDVSATLGRQSLEQAMTAAIGGFVIVALFLLLFYRFLGLVAVIGLAVYGVFLYAVILLLNVTLTLPGFAGMILTIGVAADANIVIFERIKEESRAGKSVRAAIGAGYGKGFNTILDANVVTAITALVLFAIATAGVKGFALMLLIGTAISLVTAVAATRAMLGLLAGFRWFSSPRFMGASGAQRAKWLQIDYIGRRKFWFAFSSGVVLVAAISLAINGLNLGIDFKGGTQATFSTKQALTQGRVAEEIERLGEENAVVQGRGQATGDRYKAWQVRTESLTQEEQSGLQSSLRDRLGATDVGVKNVSSSFGRQIAEQAIIAVLFSLFLIVIYLGIRFDMKYAIPVIVALLHDIVICVGVYSLTGREVTTATVAAVLTVLGYSTYDTIIILDRIRENVPLMRRAAFAEIGNISLWETIRRSLATTFITLLPVGALFLFGGETLKDFAFALLVGIGFGAYSSIFIAAPLLTVLKEREPEWARKAGVEPGGDGPDPDGGTPSRRRPRPRIGGPAADAGTLLLEDATRAAADQPTPTVGDITPEPATASADKRERRRQRRRTRPHGRAR